MRVLWVIFRRWRPRVRSVMLFAKGPVTMQLNSSVPEQVTLSVAEEATDGSTITSPLGTCEWTSDDSGAFVTLVPSADGFSVDVKSVAGAAGTATVTATVTVVEPSDGSTKVFSGSDAIVVFVPQPDVAGIVITEGAPTPEV